MADINNNLPEEAQTPKKKSLSEIQVPNWVAAVVILGFIVIGAVVYFWILPGKGQPVSGTDIESNSQAGESSQVGDAVNVEVLPQTERTFGENGSKNPFKSEDLSGVVLTGTIVTSSGSITGIVETPSASYIVNEGDVMKDSNWTVGTITQDSITFVNGESRKTIYMVKE